MGAVHLADPVCWNFAPKSAVSYITIRGLNLERVRLQAAHDICITRNLLSLGSGSQSGYILLPIQQPEKRLCSPQQQQQRQQDVQEVRREGVDLWHHAAQVLRAERNPEQGEKFDYGGISKMINQNAVAEKKLHRNH